MSKHKLNFTNLLIYILISNAISQVTVYPDHYLETDSPYSMSSLYLTSDIKERQIYKLGYFSTGTTNIKSYKFGLIYKPDNFCIKEDNSTAISNVKTFNKFFSSIKNETSTREKNNFSEELLLLKHYCSGKALTINAPFPTLHNTGYILKYKLSMTNSGATSYEVEINVYLHIDSKNENNLICKFKMKNEVADWFKMTIKSKLTTSNKITMIFSCEGEDESHNFDVKTDETFKFLFNSDNSSFNIYISFYQVILEDSSSSYALDYNGNNNIRTYNGLENCGPTDERKCLIGFFCNTDYKCQKCDEKCLECENDVNCQNCNVLTDEDGTGIEAGLGAETCKKNYIDLSNFGDLDIDVPLPQNDFHERSTMGFWIFISDLSKARKGNANIYHVVLKDRYVISIIPNELSTGVYCHAYEDLYRTITSETIYESHYTDRESSYVLYRMIPSDEQLKYINGRDLSGQWFHVSCGLSFDHKMYHLTTVINGEEYYIETALRHENLYYDSSKSQYVENDIFNRHIINDGKLKLEFRNFGRAGTKVYLKYFLLFQEYIPPSYKFMYSNLYDSNHEMILLQIKFDELIDSSNYKFRYKTIEGIKTYNLQLSALKELDLLPPKNFKLLFLPEIDKAYKTIDCSKDENNLKIIEGDGVINWDKNKPLFCAKYLNTKQNKCEESSPCLINGQKYIPFKSYMTSGFCDNVCSGPMSCGDSDDYCRENDNNYNLFYSCETKEKKYYLQYSSFYNPDTIKITVNPPLNSYIIEIWYYPDFFLSDTNRQGKFYYPDTLKNYVFYSNVATAYFLHSELKKLKVEDKGSTYTSSFYHPYEWNKLMFYGKMNENRLFKYFIINNLVNDYIQFRPTPAESLQYILFQSTVENDNNNWASGYYRGLRIWDGTTASPELVILYDYYSSSSGKINALKYYFPLTNEYIAENSITDITGKIISSVSQSTIKLRRYNFSSKFDFIRSQYPSLAYYLIADSTAPKVFSCAEGCLRCWSSGANCYECSQGYILTLERACLKAEQYFFKSPCDKCGDGDSNKDAVLSIAQEVYSKDDTYSITVTFWVKIYGFNSNNPHILVSYSSNDRLVYNETNSLGLCLISQTDIIANDKNFVDKIGKWTYIAISYIRFFL